MDRTCETCGAHPGRPFGEVFAGHTLRPGEREALVWHLAAMRARKTVEALLPDTNPTQRRRNILPKEVRG